MVDAVVDTNVFVSALLGGRSTARLYTALLEGQFHLVLSPSLFDGILTTLARPSLELSASDIDRLVTFLRLHARFVHPRAVARACRDPEDNAILACALAARASCIVTGDRDLLILHPFHGIPIISPAVFLGRLRPD